MTPPSSRNARKVKGRGPQALRNAQQYFDAIRGRPAKGRTAVGTTVRSLRLPNTAWAELERVATERGLAPSALVRMIIAEFLYADLPTKGAARRFMEDLTSGPLTLGEAVRSTRLGERLTQAKFARKLRISVQHLSEVERGRRTVPPETAARWAKRLGYVESVWVQLALTPNC